MLDSTAGQPSNPKPPSEPRFGGLRTIYITLDRQVKYEGTPGCTARFGYAEQRAPECRKRFEDFVGKEPETGEAAQAAGDSRMGASAVAAVQPSAAQGVRCSRPEQRSTSRRSGGTKGAHGSRRCCGPRRRYDRGCGGQGETVEKIREAKWLRFPENLRLIASLPTMRSTADILGAMAGQACGSPPLPEENGEE